MNPDRIVFWGVVLCSVFAWSYTAGYETARTDALLNPVVKTVVLTGKDDPTLCLRGLRQRTIL